MSPLAKSLSLSLFLGLFACGGDHGQVDVLVRLSTAECQDDEACGVEYETTGVVAEAYEPELDDVARAGGDVILFADFETAMETLAVVEISLPADGSRRTGPANIRYREVKNGRVVFRGVVVDQQVELSLPDDAPAPGTPMFMDGTFTFIALDRQNPEANQYREVIVGQVSPSAGQTIQPGSPRFTTDPGTPSRTSRTTPRPTSTDPYPDPDPDSEPDVDAYVVLASGCDDYDGGGGCDGSDAGGCDGSDVDAGGCEGSGGGCEADSYDASGCDGSSGCEADSFDAGGCDSCSSQRATERQRRRALSSLWRLAWPMLLVGALNRRWRRR